MQSPEENQRRLKFMERKEFHSMSWLLITEKTVSIYLDTVINVFLLFGAGAIQGCFEQYYFSFYVLGWGVGIA